MVQQYFSNIVYCIYSPISGDPFSDLDNLYFVIDLLISWFQKFDP